MSRSNFTLAPAVSVIVGVPEPRVSVPATVFCGNDTRYHCSPATGDAGSQSVVLEVTDHVPPWAMEPTFVAVVHTVDGPLSMMPLQSSSRPLQVSVAATCETMSAGHAAAAPVQASVGSQ